MNSIRNLAIIAHVDHGKTTLVDQLLKQSGTFSDHESISERVMDSNDLEKERGITIVSKNCAVNYNGVHINIVDTPGHADFGGEVERVLSMVDGVLLLVDAVEGPMPQTRFVTRKALELGLLPIVVVNKVDRPGSRPDWVINETFDLFDKLGASDEQLDFTVVYASALKGYSTLDHENSSTDMSTLFEKIISQVPEGSGDVNATFQMQAHSQQSRRRAHTHDAHACARMRRLTFSMTSAIDASRPSPAPPDPPINRRTDLPPRTHDAAPARADRTPKQSHPKSLTVSAKP